MSWLQRGIVGSIVFLGFGLIGCAGTDFVATPTPSVQNYRIAYLVVHESKESDVDAAIQRSLMRHGLTVSTITTDIHTPSAFLVKFSDGWNWDMVMYLTSLDVQFYDAQSGSLVASGTWKNGLLHGYQNIDGVAEQVVSGTLEKIGIKDLSLK